MHRNTQEPSRGRTKPGHPTVRSAGLTPQAFGVHCHFGIFMHRNDFFTPVGIPCKKAGRQARWRSVLDLLREPAVEARFHCT